MCIQSKQSVNNAVNLYETDKAMPFFSIVIIIIVKTKSIKWYYFLFVLTRMCTYIRTYPLYAYMYIRVRNRVKFGKLENVSNDLKGREGISGHDHARFYFRRNFN